MNPPENPPAFPHAQRLWDNDAQSWAVHSLGGMTLRDYFAGRATEEDIAVFIPKTTGECAGLIHALGWAGKPEEQDSCRYLERHNSLYRQLRFWAKYQYADAMLAQRAKPEGGR